MSDYPPSQFRMRMDDESSDTLIQEEILEGRIEKLSHRITLVAILIPVLIVVILVLAYLDLTKRVASFQDTGSTEVQALAKSLADRFSSLSVKQAKIEEAHDGISASLKTTAEKYSSASLKTTAEKYSRDLKGLEARLQKSVDHLGQTKTDKKALDSAVSGIEKKLGPLRKSLPPIRSNLQKVSSGLDTLNKNFSKELKHLNGSLADFNELLADLNNRLDQTTDHLVKLQAEISALSAGKIDQSALQLALDEEKKIYRQMMSLITKNIEGKLDALTEELKAIKKLGKPGGNGRPTSVQVKPPASPAEATEEKPSVKPEPGKIIEKNLQ